MAITHEHKEICRLYGWARNTFILESKHSGASALAPIENFEERKDWKKKKQTNGTCNFKGSLPYRVCEYWGETAWTAHLNFIFRSSMRVTGVFAVQQT